jgi:hypothetical protein
MDKDIARLIKLGAVIGEPVVITDPIGHYGCEWHIECADGDEDGGSANAILHYVTMEYISPVGAVLRKVVK